MERQPGKKRSHGQVQLLCSCLYDELSASWINALEHPCRRRLLRALNSRCPSRQATPEALAEVVQASRGVVAYHLKVLVDHELVGFHSSGEAAHAASPSNVFHSRVREDAGVKFVLGATQTIDKLEDARGALGGHAGSP
jgi:Helix-turn-helix domain